LFKIEAETATCLFYKGNKLLKFSLFPTTIGFFGFLFGVFLLDFGLVLLCGTLSVTYL
jgi:hypothetical protein